jgi:hypothetical protein
LTASYPPSTPLATLYELVSGRGTRYLIGRLGLAKVVLLPGDPTEDETPTWRLLVQEATASVTPRPARPERARSTDTPRRRPYSRSTSGTDPGPMPDDRIDDLWPEGDR